MEGGLGDRLRRKIVIGLVCSCSLPDVGQAACTRVSTSFCNFCRIPNSKDFVYMQVAHANIAARNILVLDCSVDFVYVQEVHAGIAGRTISMLGSS